MERLRLVRGVRTENARLTVLSSVEHGMFEAMTSTTDERTRRYRRLSRVAVITGVILASLLTPGGDYGRVIAQVQGPRVNRKPAPRRVYRYGTDDKPRVLIEPTAPIANLFARADDGVSRSDWKFTIDCLQRVLESEDPSLVSDHDGGVEGEWLFRSVRRRALERLASLPGPALASYRLLYDGRAKRLFELGVASHDESQLRRVVDRYLLTSYGDDAVDSLASWMLDAGRPDEAIRLLNELSALVADRDDFGGRAKAQIVAALTMQGNRDEIDVLLDRLAMAADQTEDAASLVLAACKLSRPEPIEPKDADPWPMVGGTERRLGRMPAVEPTFLEPIPWRCDLPGSAVDTWRLVFTNDPAAAVVLPVGQPVTDGRSVYVRTRDGSIAMDPENLSLRWLVDEEPGNVSASRRSGARGRQLPGRSSANRTLSPMFEDYVAGGIGVAHGLVLNIARTGSGSEYDLADRDTGGQWRLIPRLPRQGNVAATARGSRLIAYDAETGTMRWQRGRSADPDDPLGEVEFRCIPVPVGNTLWVSFIRQNDLFAGEIDPRDGALLRRVLLGSFRDEPFRPPHTLPLAVSDGVIYVPSGEGVLFALDAASGTLRWASQYKCSSDDAEGQRQAEWLPTPPMVTRGLVLLAPTEHSDLMAFSMETGEVRWTVARGSFAYLVAADADHVWIGGRDIACLDLRDGSTVWRQALPSGPTGRAVLSSDVIYAPVLDGLVSLHAPTGATVEHQPLPTADEPLGNMLCFAKAMFVSNPTAVRKFPDLRRIYPETLAAYAADPADLVVAVRLAWLELLRNEPERAHDVLARLPVVPEGTAAELKDDIAHVRVEVLLTLARRAGEAGRPSSVALGHLEAAVATARTVLDKWRCGMAMADQLTTTNRLADAYRYLWRLGIGPDAEHIGELGEYVSGCARVDVAGRLGRLADELDPEQRQDVTTFAQRELTASVDALAKDGASQEAERRLRAIAEIERPIEVARQARLTLAEHYRDVGRYEQAEQILREAMRTATTSQSAMVPLMRLCQVYDAALSAGVASADALAATLNELTSRFPSAVVPDGFGSQTHAPAGREAPTTLAEWADGFRVERRLASLSDHHAVDLNRPFAFTGDLGWSRSWDQAPQPSVEGMPPRLVDFGTRQSAVLADRVILQAGNDFVYCLNACDGEPLWRTELRIPGEFPDRAARAYADPGVTTRLAVLDGQTAIFSGVDGLFAVGVVTGRRLWVRPYESGDVPPIPLNGDWLLAADRGVIAAMPRVGRLTLMRAFDGGTIWERDLRGEAVGRILLVDDRVVTIDEAQQRVHFFDRRDGRLIDRAIFRQPDPVGLALPVVVSGGVVCGPVYTQEFQGVSATSVETGQSLWRMPAETPIGELFVPKDGYVGVSLLGGEVRIIDAATGDILISRSLAEAHLITDGALVDGTLLLQYIPSPNRPDTQRFAAMDVATGEEMWRADDLAPLTTSQLARQVRAGRLPVAVVVGARPGMKRDELPITMLDVDTGESVGMKAVVTDYQHALMAQSGVQILPAGGVGLVGTGSTIRAYRLVQDGDRRQQGL